MADAARARSASWSQFALENLPSMRLDDGAFCHEVAAPGLEPAGRSLRYTLICLLGLQRAQRGGTGRAGRARRAAAPGRSTRSASRGDHGRRPWPAALGGRPRAGGMARQDRVPPARASGRRLSRSGRIRAELGGDRRRGGRSGPAAGRRPRAPARARRSRPAGSSATATRARARFPNFATQIYGVLALARAAASGAATRWPRPPSGRPPAGAPARRRRLALDLRHALAARVVEPYEVYSVHQDAMAPMALSESERGERR